MIDLRGISTNWFKNRFCPSIGLSRLWALELQGNENRFATLAECEKVCPTTFSPVISLLQVMPCMYVAYKKKFKEREG
jgi:hypothetical protein